MPISDAERRARAAERSRLWRSRHPEVAAAHLETIKGRPRRKKVKPPVVPVTVPEPMDSVTNAAESVTDHTLAVTAEVDVVKTQPEAAPQPASTTALDELVAELQEIRVGLRQPDLTNTERATLRLRADVLSRLIVATEKLSRAPKPAAADNWLSAYQGKGQ